MKRSEKSIISRVAAYSEPFTTHHSQIIPRISFRCPDILPHISPESQYHVNDNRGAHRKNGGIHKILPDLARRYSHPVANGRTNTKGIPFYKTFQLVHPSNLQHCYKRSNKALFTPCFFVISPHLLFISKDFPSWYLI